MKIESKKRCDKSISLPKIPRQSKAIIRTVVTTEYCRWIIISLSLIEIQYYKVFMKLVRDVCSELSRIMLRTYTDNETKSK